MTEGMGRFNRSFQIGLLASMIQNEDYGKELSFSNDIIKAFDDKITKDICHIIVQYYQTYEHSPTLEILQREMQKKGYNGLKHTIKSLFNHREHQEYYLDEADAFVRHQKLRNIIVTAAEHLDHGNLDDASSALFKVQDITKLDFEPGLDYFNHLNRDYKESDYKVGTGIKPLDQVLVGGLGVNELGVIQSPPGWGKSMFLVHVGRECIKQGMRVLHYTFELSAHRTQRRYDASFLDMTYKELSERKEEVEEGLTDLYEEYGRSLIIKEYPSGKASLNILRSHIKGLERLDFCPDVIIIDYADLMRSSRQYNDLRHELGCIYGELRAFSAEAGVPIWTGSKANRMAIGAPVYGMERTAESFDKAFIADVLISICQTQPEKRDKILRLYVAKNRNGIADVEVECKYNFEQMQFCTSAEFV